MTKKNVIEWIEKYEAGEVEPSDYQGSWRELMEAVANGAVNVDEVEELIILCAHLADESGSKLVAGTVGGWPPGWVSAVKYSWGAILDRAADPVYVGEDPPSACVEMLIRCGTAADSIPRGFPSES